MNIAEVDAGTHLRFERIDRAFRGNGKIAIQKAAFSLSFPFTTCFADELAYGKAGQRPAVPALAQTPGVVAFAGGRVMTGSVQIGGIGV